jgi:hypothetical protein
MPPEEQAAVDAALGIVREAGLEPDSPAGVAVLRELLPHLLASAGQGAGAEEGRGSGPRTGPSPSTPSVALDDGPLEKVARWARADANQIADLIEFSDEGAQPSLSPAQLPATKAKQQRLLAMLKLATDRIAYEREEVETRDIYRLCDAYGIADQNIAQNLINRGNYVTRRGQRGARTYRVTVQGLEVAKKALVELASANGRVEI